jgi:hypothetical protein
LEASGWICISVSPGEPLGGLLQSLEPELEVGRDIR